MGRIRLFRGAAWVSRIGVAHQHELSKGRLVKQYLCRLIGIGGIAVSSFCFAQTEPAPQLRQEALALEQQGKNREAEIKWRALMKEHPANPEPMAHIGLLEARQQHYKEAVPFYQQALAKGPSIPGLRLNLALALFKSGQLKEAATQFEILYKNAAPNSPEQSRAAVLTGMAYYGLGDYAHAAPYLKEASAADPKNMQLLLALEHSYLWSGQMKYVLDVYHQILILNPDSAEADVVAGEALDQLKDKAGATEMFRAAVKADPKLPNAHFGLGYLLWTQRQYPAAAQEFEAELANDPKNAEAMLYLADANIKMDKHAEGEVLLQKSIEANPSLPLAHLDLGILEAEAGRNDEALVQFKAAEEKTPDDVNVHWRLARLYRTMGRKDESKAEFDKASRLNQKADDSLFDKIQNGRAHPPPGQTDPQAEPKTDPQAGPNR
jgi:tetratricopeptide (TPR) repeat protein